MNPIVLITLIALILLTIWAGRAGVSDIKTFFKKRIRQILGGTFIAIGCILALRGLWQIAFVPTILGFWLMNLNKSTNLKDLLKHYLNRSIVRRPSYLHDSANTWQTGSASSTSSSVMTKQEAYQILGLEPNQFSSQSREAITAAYRLAMKKAHPDQGGTSDLAVRLNIARDILLS